MNIWSVFKYKIFWGRSLSMIGRCMNSLMLPMSNVMMYWDMFMMTRS